MSQAPSHPSPVPRWRGRLRAFSVRVAELWPWTPLGMLSAAGTWFALRELAFEQLDLVLLVVGYAAVGLLLLSTLVTVGAAVWLGLRAAPEPSPKLAIETGAHNDTGFSLPTLGWVPLLQLDWTWLREHVVVDTTADGGRRREQVQLSRRGQLRGVTRRLVVQDAFGLCRIAVRRRDDRAFDVLPHVGALRSLPSLFAHAGGDDTPHPHGLDAGDRIELSRYMPGDPARFIHWKIFGRTGKLMVRRPERALSTARRVAAFLVVGEQDEASAAAARVAIERRLLGNDWVFGADVDATGTSDPRTALDLVVRSVEAVSSAGHGAAEFFERASAQGPVSAVVFVPPAPGPWLPIIEELASRRRLNVVIGTDGVPEDAARSWWQRLVMRTEGVAPVSVKQLDAVVHALSARGCTVTVVDRSSGRLLGEGHRAGMRARVAVAA